MEAGGGLVSVLWICGCPLPAIGPQPSACPYVEWPGLYMAALGLLFEVIFLSCLVMDSWSSLVA